MPLTPSTTGPTLSDISLPWRRCPALGLAFGNGLWSLIIQGSHFHLLESLSSLYVPKNFHTLFSPREEIQKLSYWEVSHPDTFQLFMQPGTLISEDPISVLTYQCRQVSAAPLPTSIWPSLIATGMPLPPKECTLIPSIKAGQLANS